MTKVRHITNTIIGLRYSNILILMHSYDDNDDYIIYESLQSDRDDWYCGQTMPKISDKILDREVINFDKYTRVDGVTCLTIWTHEYPSDREIYNLPKSDEY